MAKAILVVPTAVGCGLTSSVMGLYHAFDREGLRVQFFKPVLQGNDDFTLQLLQGDKKLSISLNQLQNALNQRKTDTLMETILQQYELVKENADVVLMEGLLETAKTPYATEINQKIARALGADVIIVASAKGIELAQLEQSLDYSAQRFMRSENDRLLGVIVNWCDDNGISSQMVRSIKSFAKGLQLLAIVPVNQPLTAPRVLDLQRHLNANVLLAGEINTRRINEFVLFARSVPNATSFLVANNAIFCAGDRDDAMMAVSLAVASGTKLACLVLTGPTVTSDSVMALCRPLLEQSGLPVLHVDTSSWELVKRMNGFNSQIPLDDEARANNVKEYFAEYLRGDWLKSYVQNIGNNNQRLSPAFFRYQIVKRAQDAKKTIVLPEGDEPRTVVAASICADRFIAKCVLLAKPDKVQQVAKQQGVVLNDWITVIDPETVASKYVDRLVDLRKHKGMNEAMAIEQLKDNVMLGTMMLEAGEVDGLVSGAVHTTANTMRPPLQIIKTAPGATMVSSVFFMCLPEQVLVYGDCAIVPQPTADELAQIAIQSHDSAKAFGIDPKVAMISYSTGTSGFGAEVEKVKLATEKVKQLRPDIVVDGPLQYDAAAVKTVAQEKAPNSPVAGNANVFIFPDLNTGNTTYKAVQRSANAISMGPVLQGMRKPVNDLSRGALVEDIVYTIAITAVQAV